MKEISIDEGVVNDQDSVKGILRDTLLQPRDGRERVALREYGNSLNLYDVVRKEFSNDTRNSSDQINYLDSYERALSVFRETALQLRNEMNVMSLEQRLRTKERSTADLREQGMIVEDTRELVELREQVSDAIFLSNRYALCFAGYVGLALLGSELTNTDKNFSFGTNYYDKKDDDAQNRDKLTAILGEVGCRDILKIARSHKNDPDFGDDVLKYTLESIFTTWANQFDWNIFGSIADQFSVSEVKLQYDKFSMGEGVFKKAHDLVIVQDLMNVRKADVIGNRDYMDKLGNNLNMLISFDPETGINPYESEIASVIFSFSEPGGGKTIGAHASLQEAVYRCEELSLPIWVRSFNITDFATHFQNQTATNLRSEIDQILKFPGAVAWYFADADVMLQSRKDPHITQEQKQTMGVIFSMFDGTLIPKTGKFLSIMDVNYTEGIDDATKSRICEEVIVIPRFSDPVDFAELAKMSLTKNGEDVVSIKENEWTRMGEYLLESGLSNREIVNVIKTSRRNFILPDDMVGKSLDDHIKFRQQFLEGITAETVTSAFDDYIGTRIGMEDASLESMSSDGYSRFKQAHGDSPKSTEESLGTV